jgi:DNA-binding PadR family transcriptional regulator
MPVAAVHIVLALLQGELHGYALMRRVEELSDAAVRLGPGTLYGTVNRLVADGLIEETTARDARRGGASPLLPAHRGRARGR